MSDVNNTLGAAGAGELVEAADRVWSLSHVGPGLRAKYSAWCKLRARQELIGQKADLGEADYREQLAVLNEQLAAGSYNWGTPLNPRGMGSAVQAILAGEEGQLQLLALLLEKGHGKVGPEDIVQIATDNSEGLRQAVRICLGLPAEESDPNAHAPVNQPGIRTKSAA